jgi:phosphomannomutase
MTPETLYENYLNNPLTAQEKEFLIKNKDRLIQNNLFEKELSFGTGGVREIVEHGTNRLNKFNIARLTLALVKTIHEKPGKDAKTNEKKIIVIAYDSRLTSPEFSRQTYHILKNNDFTVKIFRQPTPTPLLSFAVRHYKASAGIVLTASHNTSEYNGYKVYGDDGGQIVSPDDLTFETNYMGISYLDMLKYEHLYNDQPPADEDVIEEEIYEAYLKKIQGESFIGASQKKISILYSPLHGTGGWIFKKIFPALNFTNFHLLAEQSEPDGNFPTVKSPNPEEPGAFELLMKKAHKDSDDGVKDANYDILLATDPDADRVGVAVKNKGGYTLLTGNQICALLLDYLIRKKHNFSISPYVCKTIVTSDLVAQIASVNDIRVVEVLTGFKNIAAAIGNDPDNYIFGGEESFGYLPVNWIRDKDSISSAVALCEMADAENLVDTLENIYVNYGFYYDHVFSIKLTGGDDERVKILQKMDDPLKFISSLPVTRKLVDIMDLRNDHQQPSLAENQSLKKKLGRAGVVKFFLTPDASITIRPSGTEPKIKIYISLKSPAPVKKEYIEIAQKELADEGLLLQREITQMLTRQES